ncbi:hypothetical protein SAMN04487786_2599 [Paenisporosarcina quisquiliarum]|nr:hypothetical protein SAMN04487786_2599 [Paenisporosarcina quisquiliarum]
MILPNGITGLIDNMEEMIDGQQFKKICYEVLRLAKGEVLIHIITLKFIFV